MAGNSSNILTYVLVGGAAYLAYNWWQSQPAAAPTGSGSPPPCNPPNTVVNGVCTPPTVSYVPPVMSAQLQRLAGTATKLNADQWNYYYTTAPPQGLGQPQITNYDTIFFPTGRPADPANNPQMTAQAFVAALGVTGLSGVGFGRRIISVPKVYLKGRGFAGVKYTLGDLRKAGRR